MTEQLQASQRDLPEQIADVQRVRRRVKADIGGELCSSRALRELAAIGRVVNQSPAGEFGDDITELRHASRVERAVWCTVSG
ncbi:MAG: hypothetical protein RLZZ332_1713 [Actinomycetota bacterium]